MTKNDFDAVNELFWLSEDIVTRFIKDIEKSRHYFKERSLAKDVSIKEENDIFIATWIFILFELDKILDLYKQKKREEITNRFISNVVRALTLATKIDEGSVKSMFIEKYNEQNKHYTKIIKGGEDYKKLFHEFLANIHENKEDFLDNIATDIGFFEGAYLWVLDYRILVKRLCHETGDITALSKTAFEKRIMEAQKDTKKIMKDMKEKLS